MPRFLNLALAAAIAYALACVALFFMQRRMLFPAPLARAAMSAVPGSAAVAVEFEGGATGAYLAPPSDAAPVAVYFHGNGEDVGQQGDVAAGLARAGCGFLAIEYPGYGRSAGAPTEAGIYAATEAGLAWLAAQGVSTERVVLVGRSLGSGAATEFARRGFGAALVLVSPFESVPAMARRVAPWAPVGMLVRDRFDNLAKAPSIDLPALVLHGDADEVIPFEHGRAVAGALPKGTFRALPRVGHNDVDVGRLVPEAVTEVWEAAQRRAEPTTSPLGPATEMPGHPR